MDESLQKQQEDFELIGRFLDFDLTEEELKQFEERMANDPVLQKRFSLYQEMSQHVEEVVSGKEKSGSAEAGSKTSDKKAKIRSLPIRPLIAVAATVALLVVFGLWWKNSTGTIHTNQSLANLYWEQTDQAHLFESTVRSDDSTDTDEQASIFFRRIKDLQENGQYAEMAQRLENYLQTTTAPIPFEDDAAWLLALAYLGNNDRTKAKNQLENLISRFPARKDKARNLLDDINSLE